MSNIYRGSRWTWGETLRQPGESAETIPDNTSEFLREYLLVERAAFFQDYSSLRPDFLYANSRNIPPSTTSTTISPSMSARYPPVSATSISSSSAEVSFHGALLSPGNRTAEAWARGETLYYDSRNLREIPSERAGHIFKVYSPSNDSHIPKVSAERQGRVFSLNDLRNAEARFDEIPFYADGISIINLSSGEHAGWEGYIQNDTPCYVIGPDIYFDDGGEFPTIDCRRGGFLAQIPQGGAVKAGLTNLLNRIRTQTWTLFETYGRMRTAVRSHYIVLAGYRRSAAVRMRYLERTAPRPSILYQYPSTQLFYSIPIFKIDCFADPEERYSTPNCKFRVTLLGDYQHPFVKAPRDKGFISPGMEQEAAENETEALNKLDKWLNRSAQAEFRTIVTARLKYRIYQEKDVFRSAQRTNFRHVRYVERTTVDGEKVRESLPLPGLLLSKPRNHTFRIYLLRCLFLKKKLSSPKASLYHKKYHSVLATGGHKIAWIRNPGLYVHKVRIDSNWSPEVTAQAFSLLRHFGLSGRIEQGRLKLDYGTGIADLPLNEVAAIPREFLIRILPEEWEEILVQLLPTEGPPPSPVVQYGFLLV